MSLDAYGAPLPTPQDEGHTCAACRRDLVVDGNPRCWRCDRMLAISLSRPWIIRCPKCKSINPKTLEGSTP